MNELGKSAVLGDGSLEDAKLIFQKKFKDKSGLTWDQRTENPKAGKYVFVEKNYDPESDHDDADDGKPGSSKPNRGERKPPPCTLEPAVQELMQLIFNQQYFAATMSAMNYDDEKMPLGKLSRASIMRGFQSEYLFLSGLLDVPPPPEGKVCLRKFCPPPTGPPL